MSADEAGLPPRGVGGLTSVERRILGCLIEKELTTPQYYPLTLNGLLAACNQATSRDPVVNYDEQTVQAGVNNLYRLRLAARVHPSHGRSAVRYRHLLAEAWSLDTRQLALLAVLLLRGPQTSGELKARTERMAAFENMEDLQRELDGLIARGDLVVRLPKAPGQKEERYCVPESGVQEVVTGGLASTESFFNTGALGPSDVALAKELAELRQAVEDLTARVGLLEARVPLPVEAPAVSQEAFSSQVGAPGPSGNSSHPEEGGV